MQRQAGLEMPGPAEGDLFFALKDVVYTPKLPRKKEPFAISGKVELFGFPFLAPLWIVAKVTYPAAWWPPTGPKTRGEGQLAFGGDFEIKFPLGFENEGEFALRVEVHGGPTYTIDSITVPPMPPLATYETTFTVGGEVPPEELGFKKFRILSYSKNGGTPVTPPGALELDIGDRCRVNVGFDHMNGAVTGEFHAAIWQPTAWDPHDEILNAEKAFSVPSSPNWVPVEDSIDIIITSAISPGTYGLYVKIMGITGGDIRTEYLENVIKIAGVPPEEADIKDFDLKLQKGTYDTGASVPFTAPYDYKGIEQEGKLTIEIGTGVYPAFISAYTYEPIPVEFAAAADWEHRGLEGNITLPDTLEPGQTYSVRARLETLEAPTQETDTDWSAFTIKGVAPPTSDIRNFDLSAAAGTYDMGASVPWTAPYEYKGKAQGGWLTISLGTGVAPSFFTKHTFSRVAVSFAEAMDWTSGYLSGSFTLPASLEPGQTYSVRAKLETADGKQETDTDWGVIEITGIPVPPTSDIRNFDLRAVSGSYGLGEGVSYTAPYEYKGKAQGGWLTISLGTGPVGTFFTKYTFSRVAVSFAESMDWVSRQLQGSFTLPATLEVGQTYSVRARLETADGKQETDTDWGVIEIKEYVPPPPETGILFFTPDDEPIDYVEWCVEWAPDTGTHFVSEWRGKGFMVIVKNPVTGGGVPLTGRGYAWLWPGAGTAKKYGPTPRYRLEDGTLYEFSVAYAEIYEK